MKKLILMFALVLGGLSNSYSENDVDNIGGITGIVLDKTLQEPLPFVTVSVRSEIGDIITGGITDENGMFQIKEIPEGEHSVTIQFVGYKKYTTPIAISRKNRDINLGTILLEEEATSLDELTIVAERTTIQQKVDRKVITIGKDLSTAGPTAGDIMNNLPSVSVDQQTGSLSLRGNQNVQVMVDGKLSNVPVEQLLKQIPSTSIKQIELITNPSAKYNPEGMSGLINIILHKNTNLGFNATLNSGFTYQDNPKWNTGIDLNYRNGKFNFYGSWGGNYNKEKNFGFVDRLDEGINQDLHIFNDNNSNLFKIGVDYYIDDKNTISIFTNQNLFNGFMSGSADVDFSDSANNVFQTFRNDEGNTSGQYNLNYKRGLAKEGSFIELEVDHNIFDGDENGNFIFSGANPAQDYIDLINTERDRTTINLDYETPISETLKLEAGVQARVFDTKIGRATNQLVINPFNLSIDPDTFILAPSTDFDYSRDIYSVYASMNKKWEKWTAQFGLRFETVTVDASTRETFQESVVTDDLSSFTTDPSLDVTTEGNTIVRTFGNDYQQLYPSVFLTYTPSEENQYQISYSRRIDRPGIGQVNPIREFSTPLLSGFGNPSLVPQLTNSFEVNYTRNLEKGSVTGGVFYRQVADQISQALLYNRTDPNLNSLIFTNDNFDDTASYGLEISANYKPLKWWSINGSFDIFSQQQESFSETIDPAVSNPTVNDIISSKFEIDNVVYNFKVFNNFKVNKKLTLSAFVLYRGPNENIQFEVDPMFMTNIGARYNFWEGKATLSLNYNDIFNTMKFQGTGTRPFNQNIEFNWESNTVNVGLSVRLGSNKYRAKSRKRRDKDEKEGGGIF